VAAHGDGVWLSGDGVYERLPHGQLVRLAQQEAPLICHARSTATRLGGKPFRCYDILELFCFAFPAQFVVPTAAGLARFMDLPLPATLEDEADCLLSAVRTCLDELAMETGGRAERTKQIAWAMARNGWIWGPAVLSALGVTGEDPHSSNIASGMRVWNALPEWSDHGPDSQPGSLPVTPDEARHRLTELIGRDAEDRPQQADYTSAVTAAFQPRQAVDRPNLVLAEAGTGVGKTLGYIAPASVWSEKNEGAVWISTYTKNLQRQIDGELDRLFPDSSEKTRKVVVRKGRENYLCLLNLEEAVLGIPTRPDTAIAIGLMARWTLKTRDGAVFGSDFPTWLADLLGRGRTLDLTDSRGECVYAACPHYSKCFIERAIRRSRRADIVVANHALVMVQAAMGGGAEGVTPTRYIFDEGHHLFDAADSTFASNLSGLETADLRRWLVGSEESGRSRARGLRRRIEDLPAGEADLSQPLADMLAAARALPGPGWRNRITSAQPSGPVETLLCRIRDQVYARTADSNSPYGLETETNDPIDGLIEAAADAATALEKLSRPMTRMIETLADILDDEASELETASRNRIEAISRGIERRRDQVRAWAAMCTTVGQEPPPEFVDWFAVERHFGQDSDIGMRRHWIDPTIPLAATVMRPAHGVLVTSASLRDGTGDAEKDWHAAEERTGMPWLEEPAVRVQVNSPFNYPEHTRVFIVNDVRKDRMDQVAAAYRELFLASGGGGIGLFTAISRLREVQTRIAPDLHRNGIPLLAQHTDGVDVSTLIDMFREDIDACLLGTDAVRDGVDVPGRSLRLLVFDRVPWPRPDILHRVRRGAFGGRNFDDMITRFRMKQAFGRLIRRQDDRGAFVLLDPMTPSRLLGAFPEGVEVQRMGLADTITELKKFFRKNTELS
jgi:ATP-dependent DNA helicase DinG